MKIDLVDLKVQYASIKSEIDSAIQSVIENSAFTLGQNVEEFERNFAQYCKVKYCVGVNSGTDALQFALFASGVKHGDEVILPVNTFIATAEAISHCGAIPVFVDMDEKTYNQFTLPLSAVGEAAKFFKEGEKMFVYLHNDKPLTIRPPSSVKLKIIEAEDAAKGDTVSGAKKPVRVETGAVVLVPIFIKIGETISINPETGEYTGRV